MKKLILLLLAFSFCLSSQAQWSYNTLSNNLYGSNVASIGNKIIFYSGSKYVGTSQELAQEIEIFNVTTNTKQVLTAPTGAARVNASAVALGGKVLFAGGLTPSGHTTRVDIYDTLTNTWTTAALSVKRENMGSTATTKKAFFGGGSSTAGNSKVVDIYDLTSNTWTATQFPNATLPSQRTYLCAANVGNRVLFAGGYTTTIFRDLISVYDTQNNSWLPNTTLSEFKCALGSVTYGNKAYFIGGTASYDGSDGPTSRYPSDTIDVYDSTTDTWSVMKIPRLTYAGNGKKRTYVQSALAGCKIFMVPSPSKYDGSGNPGNADTIAVYDLARNTWSYLALPHPRSGIILAAAENKIYFAGGGNVTAPFGGLNHIDIYTISPKLQLAVETTPVTDYAFDFGELLLGNQISKQLSVSNEGDYELIFKELPTKLVVNGDVTEFSIDPSSLDETDTLAPAEVLSLPISFQPNTVGDKSITIEVYSNDPDVPTYTFILKGNGVISNSTVERDASENVLSIFPVPCNEQVHIQIKKNYQVGSLILRDVLGNSLIKSEQLKVLSTIDTAGLYPGIYVLEVHLDEQVYTKRIVVSR